MKTDQSMIGQFCLQGLFFSIIILCLTACQGLYGISRENPHLRENACANCHSAETALLLMARSGEISQRNELSSRARLMKQDLNKLCTRCHKQGKSDHAIGLKPEINRYSLPLDKEGKINCATTCHNIHSNSKGKKGYLRQPARKLCLSCHDK